MKKLLAGLFIFGALFVGVQHAHASVLSDTLLKIQNLTKEIAQLQSKLKASAVEVNLPSIAVVSATPGWNTLDLNFGISSSVEVSEFGYCYKKLSENFSCSPIRGLSSYSNVYAGIGSLSPSTTYTYYIYAVNSYGKSTSSEGTITTKAQPTVPDVNLSAGPVYLAPIVAIYWDASEITSSSASVWSYLNSDGYPGVVASDRGVCYGTSPSPLNCIASGTPKTSTGDPFYTKMVNLTSNTLYYYRAYAKNSVGTVYSADRTFKTLSGAVVTNPVDGVWSSWTNSGSCVGGYQTQTRTCTPPSNGGLACSGNTTQQISCSSSLATLPNLIASKVDNASSYALNTTATFNGTITNNGNLATSGTFNSHFELKSSLNSSTSSPMSLAVSSGTISANGGTAKVSYGLNLTTAATYSIRLCADQSSYSNTTGTITESNESDNCGEWASFVVKDPGVTNPVDGVWSSWTNSGSCVGGYQTQTRTCTPPSNGGLACSGLTTQQVSCSIGLPNLWSSRIENISVSVTPTYALNTSFTFAGTITNSGGVATTGTIYNHLELAMGFNGSGSVNSFPVNTSLLSANGGSTKISYSIVLSSVGNYSARFCADQVSSVNRSGSITESSETDNCGDWANFIVIDPSVSTPSITVTSPNNGGESVEAGGRIEIRWMSPNISSALNEIYISDGVHKGHTESIRMENNLGSVIYTLDSNLIPGSNYKAYVSMDPRSAISASDSSDNPFTIKPISGLCPTNVQSVSCPEYQTEIVKDANGCVVEFKCSSTLKSASIPDASTDSLSDVVINRVLKRGTKGDDVKKLQQFLGVDDDGIFGRGTAASVKAWQAKNGLAQDGLFGYNSRTKAGL